MSGVWQRHKYRVVPMVALVALTGLGLTYRQALVAWFSPNETRSVASSAPTASAAAPSAPTPEQTVPKVEFPAAVVESLGATFEAYEQIRERLASDTLDGVGERGRRLKSSLKAAKVGLKQAPEPIRQSLERAVGASEALSQAESLESARSEFAKVSEALVLLASADQRLAQGRHVFFCPMAKNYKKWVQPSAELRNPYMGQKMLSCGSESEWTPQAREGAVDGASVHSGHAHDSGAIAYYTCSMHPSVKQPGPGKCPICSMDLTPVTRAEVETGVIFVDAKRRQLIGVKTGVVERRKGEKTIRTVGRIAYDETRLTDVTLKYKGWIGRLYADATGEKVKRGYPLFTVYSPEVYAAQMEYLVALGSGRGAADAGPRKSGYLAEVARDRLRLWDIPVGTIDQIAKSGKARKYVPIVSPASGYVVEKNVVEGSTVEAGARLFRIANLDKVWIEADLYESELPLVEEGQKATVSLPYLPDKKFEGQVTFVYPYLERDTRTGRARIALDNEDVELRPDMFANVELRIDLGERLIVPESAVIYAGPRRVVFLDLGAGKLRPQTIETGLKIGNDYEVLKGLKPGDRVVTSGNFLVAAESRLKSAEGQW